MAEQGKPNVAGGIGALVGLVLFAACSIGVLHHDDAGNGASSSAVTTSSRPYDEQEALDAVSGDCTETPNKLAAEAAQANDDMAEKGVVDETTATVLQHLKKSIPTGAPVMDCAQILAAYVILRTSGG